MATDPGPGGHHLDEDGSLTLVVRADGARVFRFPRARLWTTAQQVKLWLRDRTAVAPARQRLFFQGRELPNWRTLNDAGVTRDGAVLQVTFLRDAALGGATPSMRRLGDTRPSRSLDTLVQAVEAGLAVGHVPQLALDGTGGTYFMCDAASQKVACFKPRDEEPYGACNPRGLVGAPNQVAGLREGVRVGEACQREVAAYVLDRGRFAGVPATTLAECAHPAFCYGDGTLRLKVGSLQEYVSASDVASDLSCSVFPVSQVQKIAILDLRLMNIDRNDANLLCRRGPKGGMELVPIDHGYCLPDRLEVAWCDWCWLEWPQLNEPVPEAVRSYVLQLDADDDLRRLEARGVFLRPPCARTLHITTTLLKVGLQLRLTLREIAGIACREDLDQPSLLERLVLEVLASAASAATPPGSPAAAAGAAHPLSSDSDSDSSPSESESESESESDDDFDPTAPGRFWTKAPGPRLPRPASGGPMASPQMRRATSDHALGGRGTGPALVALSAAPQALRSFLRELSRRLATECERVLASR